MSILVLGGAGYIGSHTVHALIEAGRDVVVADNLVTGHRAAVHPQARLYEGDLSDRAFLDRLLERESIDGVIHFAAYSLVGESVSNPLKYYRNNLCGTEVLLEALVAHGVERIVFSSTAAPYGEPERIPILQSARTQPTNPSGVTKLSMEKMIRWTGRAHNLRYVALRYFNACGALPDGSIGEDHQPETHLIPIVLQVALGRRERLDIFGGDYPTPDGTCVRDYIHVCDLADAHIRALTYLEQGGQSDVFNLGNGVGFSNLQVVETARAVTGHPIPSSIEARRPGDPATLVASSDKAARVLGWQPRYTDLGEIIATVYRWHQSHPQGYGDR